jgi:hypothetical protein
MFYKLWVAVGGTVIMTAFNAYYGNNNIDNHEWLEIANMAAGAYLVFLTTNGPIGTLWTYAKFFSMAVQAAVVVLIASLGDGINSGEWFQVAIAAGTAIGVFGFRGPKLSTPPAQVVE